MDYKKESNLVNCNCSYPCTRKGVCCECIAYHRKRKELPACYFTCKEEASYDRSIENYFKKQKKS